MNVRQGIYDLFKVLPHSVFQCRIDPFQVPMALPGVSIQTPNKVRNNIDTSGYHDVTETVEIYVTLVESDLYYDNLDAVVLLIETTLMTNAAWVSQFSEISEINSVFGYQKAGETNQASAKINFTLKYQDQFEPDITVILERIHIDTDVISPAADPNLLPPGETLGPDGRIEIVSDFILEQ
jgi:hypothetical protein